MHLRLLIITILVIVHPALAQPCLEYEDKMIDPDGNSWNTLGWSAAVSIDLAIGGSPWDGTAAPLAGSANIFRRVNGVWLPDAKLVPQDLEQGDTFGSAVALLPTVAAVGARADDNVEINAGAVYVFRHDGFSWVQEQKLTPSDGDFNQAMGFSVSLSANRVLCGAPSDNDNGTNSGSAYIYRYNGSVWVEEAKLLPSDGSSNDRFGDSVAISGPVAVVGATNANWTGKVYVFRFNGSSWVEEADIIGSDTAVGDIFGKSVAVFGNSLIVGASGEDRKSVV